MAILTSLDGILPELPQEIIKQIFSLLPIKDGGRASCLSKTWFNAWRTKSILYLDENFCYLDPGNSESEGFLNYGNLVLQRYRDQMISIDEFKLHVRTPIVSEWIQVALRNGVKKLKLVAYSSTLVLPRTIFEAKSPLELTVEGNRYLSELKLPESMIECQHLKSIHLHYLCLHNSDLQRIISSCPMIEDLVIWDCIIDSFKVTNLSKLKQFQFCAKNFWDETVRVEAPSLECLYCCGFQLCMNASQNLKKLQLFEVGITDEFFLDFRFRFPHLEDLTINSCQNLERIIMSSASLREMKLDTNSKDFLNEVDIDAPNMTQFELNHFSHHFKELQINAPRMTCFKYTGPTFIREVSFTSVSSHCSSHINLTPSKGYNTGSTTKYFVYLKEFLKNFSESKIYLSPDCTFLRYYENFDVKEAMDLDTSVAVQVHQLNLPPSFPEKLLDGILWSCRPKTIRVAFPLSWTHNDGATRDVSSGQGSELAEFTSKYLVVTSNQDDDGSAHIKFGNRRVKHTTFHEHIWPLHDITGQLIENVLELEMET